MKTFEILFFVNKTYKFPKVIIITINYNQNQYTLDCVNSLLESDYPNFQILLIDNGSEKDNVVELENKLPADERLLLHKISANRGYVGGINYGLQEGKKLKPIYFLIMNNDTLIHQKAITNLVKTCKDYKNKAIVTGKVLYYNQPEIIQTTGTILTDKKMLKGYFIGEGEVDKEQYDMIAERDIIDDIFWLFPKALFDENGKYSEWFGFGYEQAEYALRAKTRGYKLVYTYKAKLWHLGNATVGMNVRNPYKTFWSLQGFLIFRYLFQKRGWFLKTYFTSWLVVFKSLSNDLLMIFLRRLEKKFGYVMLLSMLRFHLWLIWRIPYYKFVPRSI